MRYKEPFSLTQKHGIWQYYCYDENGTRKKFSTGQKLKGKAVEVCLKLYKEGKLVQKPKRKKAPACHAPSGGSPLFRNYARGFWSQDSKYVTQSKLLGRHITRRYCDNSDKSVTKWLIPYWGKKPLSGITQSDVEDWQFRLVQKDGLSHKYALGLKSILSVMLGQAKHDGYIKTNPCDGSLRLAATGRERGILTMDEFRRLFASPDVWEGNIMAMTGNLLAAVTGMRSREVAGLRGGDVRDGWIYVHDQYDEKYGIRETKTRDIRQIPIPAGVMRLLRSLERGEDDFLFTENGLKPVDQHYFIRKLKKALMGIGITEEEIKKRNIVFHSWRHFLNTLLQENGITGEKTRAITGHETADMTRHYTHFNVDSYRDVLGVTTKLLKSERPLESK